MEDTSSTRGRILPEAVLRLLFGVVFAALLVPERLFADGDQAAGFSLQTVVIGEPLKIEIEPVEFHLGGVREKLQLLVTGHYEGGGVQDLTRVAEFSSSDDAIVTSERGVVLPHGDGTAEVTVSVGGREAATKVHVTGQSSAQPVSFRNDTLAALSKQGCNQGACHGSPTGKGGFRLSLRAFDAKLDEYTLLREEYGRRANPLDPTASLLLLKPLMKVTHGGGSRLRTTDPAYDVLHDWVAEGCRTDIESAPRCVGIDVTPGDDRTIRAPAHTQQLAVRARYTDGSVRDITELAVYSTSDTEVADVTASGLVVAHDRGEVAVIVRYLEFIESTLLTFVKDIEGYAWNSPPANNYVDELVHAKLKKLNYLPSELCTDDEFLRRAYLDVIGILPTTEEAERFLTDSSEGKRSALIDELLERREYGKFWALKWGDVLRMTSGQVGADGVHKYHRWVENAFNGNMAYDEFARRLLTASGSTFSNPPANFYRTTKDMNDCVEVVSQIFLGARLQCAKCHNHPYERWTQDNYYGMGAFFNRFKQKKLGRTDELIIYSVDSGEVTQPRTGEKMKPWVPVAGVIENANPADYRATFADWLTAVGNPFFARVEVNRIWNHLFGRGVVDPVDDFRESNPPSNAPLLDALASDFIEHGFDRKHIVRTIVNSRTYQMSHRPNEFNKSDFKYFSHYRPRLLSAEQMLDAIGHVTGLPERFDALPSQMRATQLPAPDLVSHEFLKLFGQPERQTVCECERAGESNLGMAIQFLNGPLIQNKVQGEGNRFRKLVAVGQTDEQVITALYLSALSRPPTAEEMQASLQHIAAKQSGVEIENAKIQAELDRLRGAMNETSDKEQLSELETQVVELKKSMSTPTEVRLTGIEDICWVLLNRNEFLFNH